MLNSSHISKSEGDIKTNAQTKDDKISADKTNQPNTATTINSTSAGSGMPSDGTTPRAGAPSDGTTPRTGMPINGTMPRTGAPDSTVPRTGMPINGTMPRTGTPDSAAPRTGMPINGTMPRTGTPDSATPRTSIPMDRTTPRTGMPLNGTMPRTGTPDSATPRNGMPMDRTSPRTGTPLDRTTPRTGMPLNGTMPQNGMPMNGTSPRTFMPQNNNIMAPPNVMQENIPYSQINYIPMPKVTPYNTPMGIPLYPLYGYDSCEELDKDMNYLKQLYPNTARRIQKEVDNECDKLEYDGSVMFDEYPDKVALDKIIDRVYEKVKDLDDTAELEINSFSYQPRRRQNLLRDFVTIILLNEIFNRRRRYRSRRRWF